MPGVAGGITETVAATVTDLTSGRPVDGSAGRIRGRASRSGRRDVEGLRPPDADSAASPGSAPFAGTPASSAPPSPPQPVSSPRQPAPSGDDLLRRAVASFRAGAPVTIDLAEVDGPASGMRAVVPGRAREQPGQAPASPIDGPTSMRLTPAAGPGPAKPTPTGDVRRYSLQRVGHAHQAPTTMLLMGDCRRPRLVPAAGERMRSAYLLLRSGCPEGWAWLSGNRHANTLAIG